MIAQCEKLVTIVMRQIIRNLFLLEESSNFVLRSELHICDGIDQIFQFHKEFHTNKLE